MRYYLLNLYIGRVALAASIDLLCFFIAAAIVWVVAEPPFSRQTYLLATLLGGLASFVLLYYSDAYGLSVLGKFRRTLANVAVALGVAAGIGLAFHLLQGYPPQVAETMALVAGVFLPLLIVGRLLFRLVSVQPWLGQRVLIVGVSDLSKEIAKAVHTRRILGVHVVGFLSDDPDHQGAWVEGYPVLGQMHEIEKVFDRSGVDRVVVASKRRDEHFPADALLAAKLRGRKVESGVAFYERVTGRIYLRELRSSYLIFSDGFRSSMLSDAVRRGLDLAISGLGLLMIAPVLGLCALAIKLDSRGPVFFDQERVGKGGKHFRVRKLRSMRTDAEENTGPVWSSDGDNRITRVGRFLRKARMDELPQLWNVFRGEMSLVGPRPERPEFVDMLVERYPYFRLRLAVKPGITGWAQVRYGYVNDILAVEDKLALDLYYMKYRSLTMDLLILWKTLKTVVLLRGA